MGKSVLRKDAAYGCAVSVALAGNPNVGKSTVFNSLTGMHRHTGNWAGKTVSTEIAEVRGRGRKYALADIPGTYSLLSHSHEEEVARNFICFGGSDVTVVVCDATALEHSLSLVLQICEVAQRVVVCVNLMDEAERCGIKIDLDLLSSLLGVPCVGVVARKRKTLDKLISALDSLSVSEPKEHIRLTYPEKLEQALDMLLPTVKKHYTGRTSARWIALRLIESDADMNREIAENLGLDVNKGELFSAICRAREYLFSEGVDGEGIKDLIVGEIISESEKISKCVVSECRGCARQKETKIDKVLTGRPFAFPIMILMLGIVLWITMFAANYPSAALSTLFSYIEEKLISFLTFCHLPAAFVDALVFGVFRTTTTVVAVMLPPMAIFFPFFTLLEDSGYLPRVAYNLDRPFAKCGACGKQALTMCMGLGCNAVGITGARIIDSKRERTLAILTNSLVPCNGRLPMLVSVIGAALMVFLGSSHSLLVAALLLLLILISVGITFLTTFLLSKTLLRGENSSFTIELPPYRRPEVFRVILRSLLTKVASVLWRAVAVAAPMGLFIFILSNVAVAGESLVSHAADFLEPVGKIMGLDGKILLAFILGLPANEIVIPILIMLYTSGGVFGGELSISAMGELFYQNGWTAVTFISMALFALFHWPCSTSIITVYKETKSKKYTAVATLLPCAVGFVLCCAVNLVAKLLTF